MTNTPNIQVIREDPTPSLEPVKRIVAQGSVDRGRTLTAEFYRDTFMSDRVEHINVCINIGGGPYGINFDAATARALHAALGEMIQRFGSKR